MTTYHELAMSCMKVLVADIVPAVGRAGALTGFEVKANAHME